MVATLALGVGGPASPAEAQEPLSRVQGTVTDPDGVPAGRIAIGLLGLGKSLGENYPGATENDGTFSFDVPDGTYRLAVTTAVASRCTATRYDNPDSEWEITIAVEGQDITGIQVTVSGKPSTPPFGLVPCGPLRMVTTELHPGWNLAGWTGARVDVSGLFSAIPGLEVAYAWDAEEERFLTAVAGVPDQVGDLGTLTPGMGLWLYVSGAEPVEWTRPILPESGFATLAEGWNLLSWSGEDGVAIDDAVAGLVPDLRAVASRGVTGGRTLRYAPGAPASDNTLQQLPRGGALWVQVSRNRHWLQPGSAQSSIEYVSEIPPDARASLPSHIESVLTYFAHRFGVFVPGVPWVIGEHPTSCAVYQGWAILMEEPCLRFTAHEYAHAIQSHMAGPRNSAAWITEGVADRWSAEYYDATGDRSYSAHIGDIVTPRSRGTPIPLQEMEAGLFIDDHANANYSVAHLAIDYLVELVGEDRTFQYYRERPGYRTWQDAFHGTFGLSVDDFYTDFAEYREANFAPFEAIQGVAVTSGDDPLEGLWLGAFPPGESGYLGASTAADGTFALHLPDGAYRLELYTAVASTCTVSGYEAAVAGRQAIIRVDGEGVSGVRILAGGPPGDEAVWIPCTFAE